MNIFARSVMWALPLWMMLILLHFSHTYWFHRYVLFRIVYPGHMICLWLAKDMYSISWFAVIFANMVAYYAAMVILVFVVGRLRGTAKIL